MTTNEKLIGAHGTFLVNGIAEVTKNFFGFEVPEDTVIDSLTENGSSDNVVGDYILVPATGLKANNFVTAKDGKYFTSITLASGSANLVLTEKK